MTNQTTPAPDAMRFAAEWLRQYDDTHDGGDQTRIANDVAAWLDAQADAKELRDVAREHGVPTAGLRRKLAVASRAGAAPELPAKPNKTCHAKPDHRPECGRQVPHDHAGPCPECGAANYNIWI